MLYAVLAISSQYLGILLSSHVAFHRMHHVLLNGRSNASTSHWRKWCILISTALLNATNAMIWNSFSTVAGFTHQFYDASFSEVNMLTEIFLILSIPVGFLSMWCIDHLNSAAACNAFGASLRLISSASFISKSSRYGILLTGQGISGLAQPFAMVAPAKIAQSWFPENQRALATSIMAMGIEEAINVIHCVKAGLFSANAFGVLISALLSPLFLVSPADMGILNLLYAIPAVLTAILMIVSLNRSKPEIPPSEGAVVSEPPQFCQDLSQIVCNKMYIILALCSGIGVAIVTTLTALMAQILCPKGSVIAVMIGAGLAASIFTSIIADKFGYLQEIAKVCLILASFSLAIIVLMMGLPYNPVVLGLTICSLGIFGFGQYPIALELAVETAYPVGEATATGLMIIWGNIASVILVIALQVLAKPTLDNFGTCGINILQGGIAMDHSNGTILLASLACITCIGAVVFYNCPYRRRIAGRGRSPIDHLNQFPNSNGQLNL